MVLVAVWDESVIAVHFRVLGDISPAESFITASGMIVPSNPPTAMIIPSNTVGNPHHSLLWTNPLHEARYIPLTEIAKNSTFHVI